VLELGCAAGGNLLPFALAHPQAQVVGVDLSPAQVAYGQKIIDELGVKNLKLHAMNLAQIGPDFGTFDYIIVHGVFSWVPFEVKQAILQICRQNLSERGLAYVSYNTYPGWKAGDIVRDAMLLHSRTASSDDEKIASAKAMMTLLSNGLSGANPLAPSLKRSVEQLRTYSDYYIAHEYLETVNTPCYFVEFAAAAQEAGLAYVGDAEPNSEIAATYGPNVQLGINLVAMGQPGLLRQQYLDFSVGRSFRKSLLVQSERAVTVGEPDLSRLDQLRFAGHFVRQEPDRGSKEGPATFTNHRGRSLTTNEVGTMAVLRALSDAWPRSLGLDDLLMADGVQSLPNESKQPLDQVRSVLVTLFRLGMLHMQHDKEDAASEPARGPALIPGFGALWQAHARGETGIGQFNAWHDVVSVGLKPVEAFLLPHLNGASTENQLRTLLRDALAAGQVPDIDGKLLTGQRNLDAKAMLIISRLLDLLRRKGLLAG
jgi:hypothetical protein